MFFFRLKITSSLFLVFILLSQHLYSKMTKMMTQPAEPHEYKNNFKVQ